MPRRSYPDDSHSADARGHDPDGEPLIWHPHRTHDNDSTRRRGGQALPGRRWLAHAVVVAAAIILLLGLIGMLHLPGRGGGAVAGVAASPTATANSNGVVTNIPAAARTPTQGAQPTPTATSLASPTPIPTSAPQPTPTPAGLASGNAWRTPGGPAVPVGGPSLSAKAAFAVDLTNQSELYALHPDEPLPPASTTKLMTALVTVKHVDLDDLVTIDPGDLVDPTIYSHMGLGAGDQVTVHDLLAGLLLPSGGDAARALARYVGASLLGSAGGDPTARFVQEMNALAASLGMSGAHFDDPDGVDAPDHVMTARDLAIAAAALFEYPALTNLVDQQTLTVQVQGPNARTLTLVNTNEMLGEPGVHGVKTGTTTDAGQCLVLAIWRGTDRIITVVLGSTDRYADTKSLLAYLDTQYTWVSLGADGSLPALQQQLKQQGLRLDTARTVLLTSDQAAKLQFRLLLPPDGGVERPDDGGSTARGEVVFSVGTNELLRLPVFAAEPAGTPQP